MPAIPVLTPQQYALIQTLQAAPNRAATLLAALPVEAQTWAPAPGEWNAPQILTHLAAADPLFAQRLQRLAAERNPTVPYFGPAEAAPDASARPVDALMRFAASRVTLVEALSALPPADWARPGVHARTGPTTLAQQVQVIVSHDHEHLAQLAALRGAWERAKPPSG